VVACCRADAQASEDLKVHPTQLRNWVKAFVGDPQHAFTGQSQMNQLEIAWSCAIRSKLVFLSSIGEGSHLLHLQNRIDCLFVEVEECWGLSVLDDLAIEDGIDCGVLGD
jgi:hypothetical protein